MEQHFAELLAILENQLRIGCIGKRVGCVNHWLKPSFPDHFEDSAKLTSRPAPRADHAELSSEEAIDVDRSVWPGGCARGYQPPVPRQRAHTLLPRSFSHMFDHDVDTTPVRESPHFGPEIGGGVIDGEVRAEIPCLRQLLVASCSRDDACATLFRDLNCSTSDSTPGAEHQHVLAWP